MNDRLQAALGAFLEQYAASYIGNRIAMLTLLLRNDSEVATARFAGERAVHLYRHATTPEARRQALEELSQAKRKLAANPRLAELNLLSRKTAEWFRALDTAMANKPGKELEGY